MDKNCQQKNDADYAAGRDMALRMEASYALAKSILGDDFETQTQLLRRYLQYLAKLKQCTIVALCIAAERKFENNFNAQVMVLAAGWSLMIPRENEPLDAVPDTLAGRLSIN